MTVQTTTSAVVFHVLPPIAAWARGMSKRFLFGAVQIHPDPCSIRLLFKAFTATFFATEFPSTKAQKRQYQKPAEFHWCAFQKNGSQNV